MQIINKIGVTEVAKVILRQSRVEIHMVDGSRKDYYANDAYDPKDELSEFFTLVRNKFLDGRDRHAAQGSKAYKADTIWELQGELLDKNAYSAILFFELERFKKHLKEKGLSLNDVQVRAIREGTKQHGI